MKTAATTLMIVEDWILNVVPVKHGSPTRIRCKDRRPSSLIYNVSVYLCKWQSGETV